MKRIVAVLFLLLVLLFVTQIQTSIAHQKIYVWELSNEDWKITNEYQIVITASDAWQPNMPYEVKVRITTKKYYDVKINSIKVIFNSESFVLDSLNEEEKVFTDAGDYWEKKFAFEVPTEKLGSDQNFTVSIIAIINISAVPESVDGLKGTWDNYDEPLTVSLYLPSQSTLLEPFPTTLFVASVASVAVVGVGLLVYFKKRNH